MDPFSLMLGVSGLALQLGGTFMKSQGASAATKAQEQEIQLQQQQEQVKMEFMRADSQRKSLQVMRNMQRAHSIALNNAATQGAQFGSGLQGGYGQIRGQGGVNLQGINQALSQGEQMFGLSGQISQSKIAQLQGQQTMQMGSGLSSLGGSMINSMGMLRQLTGAKSWTGQQNASEGNG